VYRGRRPPRLLAEKAGPASGEMTGNFPRAFSRIGLINAARASTQARQPQRGFTR
jgi:alpha,alpha-trehalase